MKHTLILLLVLISTKLLLAQNDTIVYYKNHAPTPSKNGADHMVVFQKKNEKKSILMAYELHNEKWKHEKTEIIKRMKDGHYSISSGTSNFTRAYKKVNGGYYVEEYNSNDKISKKGLSKTMFPLHRIGQWQKIFDDRVVGMDIFNEELMTLSYTIYHGRKLPNNIYANADTIAEYKGGDKQFAMDLARNVEYPRICQENGITGCVLVLFAIDELGKPTDIRILRKVDPYLDQAALDAIKKCNKWKPAIKNGKPIKLYSVAPINFELR
ncbi:hypothetical protein DF185_19220 [Marinifilum breve]|uniref:TonB C-terminal domain-containing protein n=1 Tax=Marinifilum breve TaxID=2184082 RepID=A0A2V3ZTW8_9BACT|nr:energy transducer TonB [Marinifilum breve]PXX97149.1 hypothetical protein DF185_19220 [Marinifilum breve]